MQQIDFFARRTHYVDHLVPVWKELEPSERGHFFAPVEICDYLQERGVKAVPIITAGPRASNPLLVASVADLQVAHLANPKRKFAFMEHGVGITYGSHQAYAGGGGMRRKVDLFLAPNEIVRAKTEKAIPGVKQVVVGTPKLDGFPTPPPAPPHLGTNGEGRKPVVCISFHWDGHLVSLETGNAFEHFRKILPILARWSSFKLIGHGHPRAIDQFAKVYEQLGIDVVENFDSVMTWADVYVCDNSSTMYEFCVTGKPVIILNSPQYRKKVHWGIRFWDYTDIGPMVDQPAELLGTILQTLTFPDDWKSGREKAVRDLYPFLGESAKRAADALREWVHVP